MFFICIRGDAIGFRRPCGFRLILPRTPAVPPLVIRLKCVVQQNEQTASQDHNERYESDEF